MDEGSKTHILQRHIFWDWDPEDKKSQFIECSELVFKRLENILQERPKPEVVQNTQDGIYLRSIILRNVYDKVIGINQQGQSLTSFTSF